MNIYKHTAVSFAVSALLFTTLKNIQMSIACFATGVLIDLDHIFDYYINHELWNILKYLAHPRRLFEFLSDGYNKIQSIYKLYKPLHSIELLIPVLLFYVSGVWNLIATGAIIGFVVHLIMDMLPIGHIGPISIIYKVRNGFPTGNEILKKRLSKIGIDVSKCEICGVCCETIAHRHRYWYTGFSKRGLNKVSILCNDCHDKVHYRKD